MAADASAIVVGDGNSRITDLAGGLGAVVNVASVAENPHDKCGVDVLHWSPIHGLKPRKLMAAPEDKPKSDELLEEWVMMHMDQDLERLEHWGGTNLATCQSLPRLTSPM